VRHALEGSLLAPTTVIFDLGGVLVWTHWDKMAKPLADISGLPSERIMGEILTGDAYYPFMRGEIQPKEFHRRVNGQLGLNLTPGRFFALWKSVIAPNETIHNIIERLKGHCRIVLGSNTDPIHYARSLEVQEALRHFDDALLSYELGCCKPDLEFFRRGLEVLSVPPQDCVFIDDRSENVEAARSLGFIGIRFLSQQQLESELTALGLM